MVLTAWDTLSDCELLSRIQARRQDSASAFEALLDRYRDHVCRHLTRMIRDISAAEDLTQEVFLRVWTRSEQWSGQGHFRAWLLRIATNLALNHLRTVRRRREAPIGLPSEATQDRRPVAPAWSSEQAALSPEALLELAETRRRFERLVAGLAEEKREVFRLVHEGDMAVREVASRLRIPEGTVRSRLHYARKQLAREWELADQEGRKSP